LLDARLGIALFLAKLDRVRVIEDPDRWWRTTLLHGMYKVVLEGY